MLPNELRIVLHPVELEAGLKPHPSGIAGFLIVVSAVIESVAYSTKKH